MYMLKYLKYFFASFLLFLVFTSNVKAVGQTNIYFFYGQGCPHCAKEEIFLKGLVENDNSIKVNSFEVWSNDQNAALLGQVAGKIKLNVSGVPVTVVGNKAVVGYLDDQTTGLQIINLVKDYQSGPVKDVVAEIIGSNQIKSQEETNKNNVSNSNQGFSFGQINYKKLSLPILTIVIGTLDSLNPCAMWVLLFLISMMLGMNNRKRMWLLGSAFIVASAAAYFVFLAAWLNIFLFISYVKWIKTIIILVAVIAGVLNLREWWQNRNGGCDISTSETKKRLITSKLTQIIQSNKYLLAFVGIVAIAIAINMVELLCSAGLPAVYIPILTEAGLAKSQYYLYLGLYSFFYVLIQIVVFVVAMMTLEIKAVSSRITKWSSLIGGILMVGIAVYLIFKWGLVI